MSQQAFIDFYTKYLDSAAGEAARKQIDGITDKSSFAAKMVAVGAASGFQFTSEEVLAIMEASEAKAAKALAAASGELNEDQLEGVVGGATSFAGVPTVTIGSNTTWKLTSTGGLQLPGGTANMSTVMCPW
ncbi:MAG: hypothetical protein HY749_10825 [Gammaproteobacteria bacterium]|nr:hypothetical protein [Gammaproteobacteria bacterium]MBI5616898.1 hypothetical protein [Gammaproteobacteria bacterium]